MCGWGVDRDFNAALNVLRLGGWVPALVPVELRPIPIVMHYGHGGVVKQEAPDFNRGVAHMFDFLLA
jgi:putative transposase